MTIAVPTSGGWTFEAQLEEDEWHMLWLNSPNRVMGKRQGRCLLSAVLKIGWRIVESTPEERALLEAHGFGRGGCSEKGIFATNCDAGRTRVTGYHRSAVERLPSFATAEAVRADDE